MYSACINLDVVQCSAAKQIFLYKEIVENSRCRLLQHPEEKPTCVSCRHFIKHSKINLFFFQLYSLKPVTFTSEIINLMFKTRNQLII